MGEQISGTIRAILLIIVIFSIHALNSCDRPRHAENATGHFRMMDDTVLEYNRVIAEKEEDAIGDFIARYGWKMERSSTGLRYMIFRQGTGPWAVRGKTAVIRYEIRLLNGNICYSSDQDGLKEIRLGHSASERGLEEGILLMKVGDRAKLIVPSHLAFGLLGDEHRIPRQAVLVYDISLLEVK